jgi:hypothetical protein
MFNIHLKGTHMKRLITAVSFALLATPALADNGKPYEQLDVDRALPELRIERAQVAVSGNTRSDVEISTEASAGDTGVSARAEGPWANDHNFIAPAQ